MFELRPVDVCVCGYGRLYVAYFLVTSTMHDKARVACRVDEKRVIGEQLIQLWCAHCDGYIRYKENEVYSTRPENKAFRKEHAGMEKENRFEYILDALVEQNPNIDKAKLTEAMEFLDDIKKEMKENPVHPLQQMSEALITVASPESILEQLK